MRNIVKIAFNVKVIDINDDCSLKIEHDGIIEDVISSEMTIHNASE